MLFASRRDGGFTTHFFCAKGQRGPKRQPIGICSTAARYLLRYLAGFLTVEVVKNQTECSKALV